MAGMRAILILGVVIMPWHDDMQTMSSGLAQPVVSKDEAARRRFYQQQVPGGATPKEWDQLERQDDQWRGSQDDRMMSIMELSAKLAAGQITQEQYDESMDILSNLPGGLTRGTERPSRRRR
jgi:hypothetical protein